MHHLAQSNQLVKSVWALGSIAAIVAALYLAKGVLVPLTLAVLLSFLLSPVCDWLERRRLGRIPAVLATTILGFAVLGAAAWMAVVQMTALAPKMPEYQHNLQARLHSVNEFFVDALSKVTRNTEAIGENLPQAAQAKAPQGTDEWPYSVRVLSSPMSPLQVLGGTFGTLIEGLGSSGIVILLVVFFLVRREDLRDRFIRLVGTGQVTVTTQMLEDAATRVSRYLSVLFVINATFGLAVGIGLYLIGVPNAILWGILAAIFRFVPYIGSWIAAAVPICLAMAISTGWLAPDPHTWAVRRPGILLRELPGAMALRQGHRCVGGGGPGGGRLLDLVVGNRRIVAGDAVDGMPLGNRQARSPTLLLGHLAGERAGIRAQPPGLSAAAGRGSRRGDRIGRRCS